MLPEHFPPTGLVAHRGLAASLPENTLLALEAAAATGTCILEFDLQLSADGVPVVFHDESLIRTCGVEGRVGDHSASALMRMQCGYANKFGDEFDHVTIASHAATVEVLAAYPDSCLLAEIKDESIARFGLRACMEPVLEALSPVQERVAVISFQAAAVAFAQARGFAVGWCIATHDASAEAMANRLQPELLLTDEQALVSPEALWAGGWRWASWEVLEVQRARELFELGVDYVETMACDQLGAAPQLQSWCS